MGAVELEELLPQDDQEDAGIAPPIRGITRPRFSTEAKESYNQVSDWAQDAWGFGTKSEISGRINEVAYQFFNENDRWPSATELFQYENFQRSMGVYASGTPFLPPFFTVDGDLYSNDSLYGPTKVDQQHPAFADTGAAADLGGVFGSLDVNIPGIGNIHSGQSLPGFQDLFANVPATTSEQLSEILVGLRRGGGRGGGGGGGGGGGRADLVFDKRQLAEQARAIWRPMMIEDLEDPEGLVESYIKEANAFWRQGGRLDFSTFVVDRARTTQRHKNLYRRKPDHMSEAEYAGGYTQAAAGFGLSAGTTRRETEAGLTSGASLSGFTERVSRGRENQVGNSGTFSQRMANNINQLGAIGRA